MRGMSHSIPEHHEVKKRLFRRKHVWIIGMVVGLLLLAGLVVLNFARLHRTPDVGGGLTTKAEPDTRPGGVFIGLVPKSSLVIRMLGGTKAEEDQRFYQIEGESPMTWQELEKVLAEKRKEKDQRFYQIEGKSPMTELEKVLAEKRKEKNQMRIKIVIGNKSVDTESAPHRKLLHWAHDNGVGVQWEFESWKSGDSP
jgi:hypothetical protein